MSQPKIQLIIDGRIFFESDPLTLALLLDLQAGAMLRANRVLAPGRELWLGLVFGEAQMRFPSVIIPPPGDAP